MFAVSAYEQHATIILVVPHDRATRLIQRGWSDAGRGNKYTRTLRRTFASESEARQVAERTGCVYSMQVGA